MAGVPTQRVRVFAGARRTAGRGASLPEQVPTARPQPGTYHAVLTLPKCKQ